MDHFAFSSQIETNMKTLLFSATTTLLTILYIDKCSGAFYQFGYQVDTLDTGDYHGHMEQQDGFVKNGEFKVRLPDGRLQITSYQADDKGFRPKISYEIDPLFVPPPEEPVIPFTPEKKFIKRPPPQAYDTVPTSYLPPSINYDPRGKEHSSYVTPAPSYEVPKPAYQAPRAEYKAPQPATLYSPPSPAPYSPPPSKIYQIPRHDYSYEAPIINYKPKESINYLPPKREHLHNYISDEMYTPIERHDDPEEDAYLQQRFQQSNKQQYFLVPIRQGDGEEPVLVLVRKKQ